MISIKEAIKKASLRLKHLENPQKEARLLLSYFLNKEHIYLTLYENEKIDEQEFFNLINQRAKDIPLEYITKKVSFYSKEFFIDFGALIPRPETELLIDEVLKLPLKNPKIAEIGIGSGVISIMLALFLKPKKIVATDINPYAIKIAKHNLKKYNLSNIHIFQTSYLDGIDEEFDIIVSNPPYIKNDFPIDKNLTYEPQNALFGGKDGDEIVKNIVDLAIIKKVKYLACEMGYDQKKSMQKYFEQKGIKKYHFYKDLSGFDRGFVVEFDRV